MPAVGRGLQTPAEAAQRLNEKLFPLVNVRYSTQREKAIQSPLESMKSGMATCSGLSICWLTHADPSGCRPCNGNADCG